MGIRIYFVSFSLQTGKFPVFVSQMHTHAMRRDCERSDFGEEIYGNIDRNRLNGNGQRCILLAYVDESGVEAGYEPKCWALPKKKIDYGPHRSGHGMFKAKSHMKSHFRK